MTKGEVPWHSADLAVWEAAGAIIGKKRKGQSDKGVTRGPQKKQDVPNEANDQDAPHSLKCQKVSAKAPRGKKAKTAKSPLLPSKEFITTEDRDNELED
jgi:hypothetical protein